MTYILHRMATHPKNYVYVKRWRDKNKARYDPISRIYVYWPTLLFMKYIIWFFINIFFEYDLKTNLYLNI